MRAAKEVYRFQYFNTDHLLRHLVELGCIKPLCDLLTLMDSKIVQVALNGLENILRLGELEAKRGGGINPYCALIEEAYGMFLLSNMTMKIEERLELTFSLLSPVRVGQT